MSEKVTAEMVKELRERTGVGMGKCKDALMKAAGDMSLAIEILRKAGMATAVKKEGREAKEGMIGHAETDKAYVTIEVNAETDFVIQNDMFKEFVANICEQAAKTQPKSLEAFLMQKYEKDPAKTIDEYRGELILSLGENIQIRRLHVFHKNQSHTVGIYSHMGGKIVAVVEIEGSSKVQDLAKDIAMHVAAEAPDYLKEEEVPAEIIEKEKEIARSQITGKPENVVEKIVEGKLKAFYDQNCLIRQKYIKDNTITIKELVEREGKKLNVPLKVKQFVRWKVGEAA